MIRKRVIQITSVLLVMLITVTAIPMYFSADDTNDNRLYFYTTYDENGNQIRSTKQIGALHKNLAEDMFKINGKRAYCIELNTPANSSDTYVANTGSASSVWQRLGKPRRDLIRMIMCLGLEGTNKKFVEDKKVNGHTIAIYKIYGVEATIHEIYLATQLLIWEVTEGYRSTSRSAKFKSRYDLSEAYNANVRGVYRGIVKSMIKLNQRPSFTGANYSNCPTHNFKVKYTPSKGFEVVGGNIVLTDKKEVLNNYPSLASDRSIKVTAKVDGKTVSKYLNIEVNRSGNKLTLSPVKENTFTSSAKFATGASVGSGDNKKFISGLTGGEEKNIPTNEVKANLITYGEAQGKKNIQDIVGADSYVDPVNAYFKVGAEVNDSELSYRNFRVKKTMNIQGSNTEVESMEQGYYYYVALPSDNKPYGSGTKSSFKYYDSKTGKIETGTTYSQLAYKELGLNSSGRFYNKELKEYYMIVGPTSSEGQTGTIRTYMRRYMDKTIGTTANGKQVPYGNYYIYELGKKGKDFKASSTVNGDDSYIDLNPEHYEMPEGVSAYYFTYKEHLQKYGTYLAKRNGIDTSTDEGRIEYYKRLKRYCCSYGSSTEGMPNYKNFTKIKVRVTKTADDGNISNVFFKVSKLDSEGNEISTETWAPTNDEGYVERWVGAGTYQIKEIGYGPQGSLPSYVEDLPDPIKFTVTVEMAEEYDDVGYYEVSMHNKANVHIRVHKADKLNPTKYINGAKYGIYNDKGKLLEELITDTVKVGSITYDGFAESEDTYPFGDYYIQEIEAPPGYLLDTTKYEFTLNANTLDRYTGTGTSFSFNHKTIGTEETPTSVYITKTDITGKNEVEGAKLILKQGNTVIDEWTSTKEPHKIYNLVFGTEYTLTEKLPPNGYAFSESITFTYTKDGQIVIMKDDSTKVAFDKVNEEDKSISGALLQVKDSSGKVVKEWTTDGKEYVLDGVLVAGATYTLHEVSAPNVEYELAKDISFKVGTDGVKQVITMKDNYKRGSVTVHKKDEKGNILTGAEFELYKEDGTKVTSTLVKEGSYTVGGSVGTYVVDSKGTFKIDKLRFGSYYLIETKAPEGRMPYGDKIKFTIKDDATLNLEFTVNDDNSVMMNTGGSGYTVPMTVGIAVLLVSILSLIYLKRRKYNSK